MKKVFRIFVYFILLLLSFELVACGNEDDEELNQYIVTYVSTNYDYDDIKIIHNEGEELKEVSTKPNPNFASPYYSLTPDFRHYDIFASDLLSSVNEDTTVYLRWPGTKVGYINCYFEGINVGKALAFFNDEIWKLPSQTEGGIGTISYPEQTKSDESVLTTLPMDYYCIGYEWDGWYLDEECTQKVILPLKISAYGDMNFYSKKSEPYSYQLNIKYTYNSYNFKDKYVIEDTIKTVKYNTDLSVLFSELPSSLSEYEIISETQSDSPILVDGEKIQQKNNGWTRAADLDIEIKIVPKFDGYFEVKSSTNSSIDGKLLPYNCLEKYYNTFIENQCDKVYTTKIYGSSTSVAYKLSDIEEIKFKNGSSLPSPVDYQNRTYYSLLPNLKKIDLSEMVYLERIPSGFFYGAQNIEEVYAPNLPNLKTIGGGFLCYNNIKKFVFDFSNVTQIGYGFLECAFSEAVENITIDLSNLSEISSSTYYNNCGFLVVDVPISISLKIGDYTSLYSNSFKSHSDVQCHYFVNEVKSVCVANLTIYSHDAVVLSVQLEGLDNIKVLQY